MCNPTRVIKKYGTYLITGGTSGFGLEVAKWLSKKNVGQLVLVSRSGSATERAKTAIAEMEKEGTAVLVESVDITVESQVKQLFEETIAELRPLRGVFHSAMVLDDGFLKDLDESRFHKVMEPKVVGVLNLHKYTKDLKLDYFVNFSSISSLIGNASQGNYVAANAFLDAFAYYRRARNLPAITINWGVFKETGVVANSTEYAKYLESIGITSFHTHEALEALENVLEENPIQVGVFNIDWHKWAIANPKGAESSRFENLIERNLKGEDSHYANRYKELVRELSELGITERHRHLESLICDQIVKVMRIPIQSIDPHQSINKMGLDSLLTFEIRLAIRSNLGIEIPPIDLLAETSISQLTSQILKEICPERELSAMVS